MVSDNFTKSFTVNLAPCPLGNIIDRDPSAILLVKLIMGAVVCGFEIRISLVAVEVGSAKNFVRPIPSPVSLNGFWIVLYRSNLKICSVCGRKFKKKSGSFSLDLPVCPRCKVH